MSKWRSFALLFPLMLGCAPVIAQERGVVRPRVLMRDVVQGMPKGDLQEVRVLEVTFEPGDRTLFHTHRFPVTVVVLEGAFTVEVEGGEAMIVTPGQPKMMPVQTRMTGYNRSSSDRLRLILFYVSDPDTPFLDRVMSP